VRPGTPIGFVGRHYYDLSQDPHERHPQTWTDRDETGHGLLDLIERDPDPAGNPAHYKKGTLVAEQLDALRQLGYMD
jgi:hypothetical protein